MVILGVDPGSYTTGYAFLKKDGESVKVLEYGTISAGAKEAFEDRLVKITADLEALVEIYQPTVFSMESAFFAKNVHSAMVLGHVRGAIIVLCRKRGMQFFEYSPRSVKQAITGNGAASKEQVAWMVRARLNIPPSDAKLDATDALAIACTHLFPKPELLQTKPARNGKAKKQTLLRELVLKMGGTLPS